MLVPWRGNHGFPPITALLNPYIWRGGRLLERWSSHERWAIFNFQAEGVLRPEL